MKYYKIFFPILFLLIVFECCKTEGVEKEVLKSNSSSENIIQMNKEKALEIALKSLRAKGVDKVEKFKYIMITQHKEMLKSPDGPKHIISKYYIKSPDKVREDSEIFIVRKNVKIFEVTGYNGISSWKCEGEVLKDVAEQEEKKLKELASLRTLKGPLYLLSKGEAEIEEAYESKENRESSYVIKMVTRDKERYTIYLNSRSYLPSIIEMHVDKLMGFVGVEIKTIIEEYINIEGFLLASKTRNISTFGPFKQESIISVVEVKVNKEIPDNFFEKPKNCFDKLREKGEIDNSSNKI
jgi:hypothetical protein